MKKSTIVLMFLLALISWLYSAIATIFVLWSAWLAYQEGSLFYNKGVLFSWIVLLVVGYALLRGLCFLITWLWFAIFERQPRANTSPYDLISAPRRKS